MSTTQRFSIIGPGKVGQALGRALTQSGAAQPRAIVGRDQSSADTAATFIGAGAPFAAISAFPIEADDVILITVGDDDLAACVAALSARDLADGVVIAHTSGSTSVEMLAPLRTPGGGVAALHPVLAIADPTRGARELAGAWCTLQGDDAATTRLDPVVRGFGARIATLAANADRALYHAGFVFMSNYVCTLMESGLACLDACGVDRATAAELVRPLATGALDAALSEGPAAALTGPIARGDAGAVTRNLEALTRADSPLVHTYIALAHRTIALAGAKGAPPERLDAITKLLEAQRQRES